MNYSVSGEIAQAVTLELGQHDRVWASRGSILSHSPEVSWNLEVPGGAGAAVGRMFAGEGLTLTKIVATAPGAKVSLSANQPGHIAVWDTTERGDVVCTRGSFLAAVGEIEIVPTIARKLGGAVFGGAGLVLQKITGKGLVFVHGSGDFGDYELEPSQTIMVSTGNLAAFGADVDYDVIGVKGCRNIFFSGEGLFMAKLTGPGPVLTQTLKRRLPGAQGV